MSSPSGRGRGSLDGSGGGRAPAGGDDKEERRRLCLRRVGEAPPPSAPPLPAPSTESSDDELYSYSSVESDSTNDDEELAKIVDPDELEARVLAKSVRSEHRVVKRRRAKAGLLEVMNEAQLEQGLRQDAQYTARPRECEEVRRRERLNQIFTSSNRA